MDLDLSLQKNFLFGESKRLQFRADFLNAFNHPNLAAPNIYTAHSYYVRKYHGQSDPGISCLRSNSISNLVIGRQKGRHGNVSALVNSSVASKGSAHRLCLLKSVGSGPCHTAF